MNDEKLLPKLRFAGFNDEWSLHKFENIFDIKNGLNKGKDYFGRGIQILNYMDVNKYELNTESTIKGLVELTDEEIERYSVKPNDLFFTRTSETSEEIGLTSAYMGDAIKCVFSGFLLRARPKIDLNSLFFAYYLRSPRQRNNIIKFSSITTRALISGGNLSKMKIKFPSIEEQNKIANLFLILDKKVELLEKKYQVYKDFKKYLMQQIFAQKLRFDKTSEWETFALNDLGKTYNGLSGLSKDNFEKGNSKYITYKSIFDNNILKSDFTENVELNNKSQNEVKKGDLFFTGSSETPEEVGMVSVLNSTVEDCYLNSFCFGFRLNNNYDINPLFLAYYLRSPIMRNKIMILAQGSTRFNLSKKEILKLKVEIPPISEQQHVIDLFQNVDNKINEISMQTDNFNEFKKGLLQQMFV